jgi:hypothetical protein
VRVKARDRLQIVKMPSARPAAPPEPVLAASGETKA